MSILKYTTKYLILGVLALIVCLGIITLMYNRLDKDNDKEVSISDEVLPVESNPISEVPQTHSSHSRAWTEVPKSPPDDDFFKTIEFPTTPPHRPGGHYINPPQNPFPIPDFVKKYPDHFTIDADGFWHLDLPPEKAMKLEQHQFDPEITDEEYARQITEIVGEGLDTLTTATCLAHMGGFTQKANELLSQAYLENPDDLEAALSHCAGFEIDGNLAGAEAAYRRLVELYPDSIEAKYYFGNFLSENHPEPWEAIPLLEEVYRQAPFWYAPLFDLGLTYYSLGDYEKSLRYFQASEVFTGPEERSSLYIHLNKQQPVMLQKEK